MWQDDLKNYFNNAFSSWDNYHNYGIIPNLWAGITGQKSQEMRTQASIDMSNQQFAENLDFLALQHADEMAFQKKQLNAQTSIANQNIALNRDIANKNFALQNQAFQYQKELNATQMEREDSALQRQIADAQAAGLSPLSVLGGSGASSTPLSSGSAPQMDLSGVNGAVGQYLDIARQYASLHAQATQNYMNGRNQASIQHNSQVLGARTALAQMKADMHYKGQNMATQYFNAAVNASTARLNRDYMREQIKTKKYENKWYDEHGYQRMTVAQVLSDIFNRDSTKNLIANISASYDKVANALDSTAKSIPNSANIEFNYDDVFRDFKQQGLSNSDAKIMTDNVNQMIQTWNNMSLWEKTKTSFSSFINEAKLKIKDLMNR